MTHLRRLPVLVGVIGGEDRSGCARLLGRELTKHGCIVLTGGRARDGRTESKHAAIMGTIDAERNGEGIARYIGVIPESLNDDFGFEYVSPTQLLIYTHLSSMDRDPINGVTPDVLVCFAGGPGTLCELAFGIAVGREVIFYDRSAQILLYKCTTSRERASTERALLQVMARWQKHLQLPEQKDRTIFDDLIDYLRQAVTRKPLVTALEIVQNVMQVLPPTLSDVPAFPGIPGGQYERQIRQFTSWWKAQSTISSPSTTAKD